MALIDIFPISFGGIKPPLNLFDNILGSKTGSTNMLYPLDLATNPQYCHAIQFSIYEYDVPIIDSAGSLVKSLVSVGTKAIEGSQKTLQP